jgi:hypothetical protein
VPRHRLKIRGAAYTDVLSDGDTERVTGTER